MSINITNFLFCWVKNTLSSPFIIELALKVLDFLIFLSALTFVFGDLMDKVTCTNFVASPGKVKINKWVVLVFISMIKIWFFVLSFFP